MVISLDPVEIWQVPHAGKKSQNEFCKAMAKINCSCAACLRTQEVLKAGARQGAHTERCELGLLDSAVPVKLGEDVIGFLQTGQVFCKASTARQFAKVAEKLVKWGIPVSPKLEEADFKTRVMAAPQYEAMLQLLAIFAQHLSMLANQVTVQESNSEPPLVTRARKFIGKNQTEDLSLIQVANAVHTSTFYFCKMFKKTTGLTFTEYLSRIRVEKAKNLLLNPNLRVSEIAFEVGFQSITHFNRAFKKITGQSPTHYRGLLATA